MFTLRSAKGTFMTFSSTKKLHLVDEKELILWTKQSETSLIPRHLRILPPMADHCSPL